MTSERRFEHDLPDLLTQLGRGPAPDYRNQIVQQTAGMRQRPAWTFPERWLPMTAVTSRAAATPRLPMRIVALVALLILALAAGAVLLVGSQHRLPAPFGLAANGHIAYASNGDIFTVDPVSGTATAVVTGPEFDLGPIWSRDGTRFVFERMAEGPTSASRLFAVRADGRELVAVTPDPVPGLDGYTFSPDGREIVYTSAENPDAFSKLWIARADGSGVRAVDVGMAQAASPAYRPSDGSEILFLGEDGDEANGMNGVYTINVESGDIRTIVAPSTESLVAGATVLPQIDYASWSPDGARIAYTKWQYDPGGPPNGRVHIVSADGTGDRMLPQPPGAISDDAASWSNDGMRLVIVRGYSTPNEHLVLAVVPVDGTGVGVETDLRPTLADVWCCPTSEWAPDDKSILATPVDSTGRAEPQVLWDPSTGSSKPAPWAATSKPTWQRRAP